MKEILIDLSELIARPLRTGIQRVERELLRHWPGPAPLVPCRFDTAQNTLVRVPETVIARLLDGNAPTGAASTNFQTCMSHAHDPEKSYPRPLGEGRAQRGVRALAYHQSMVRGTIDGTGEAVGSSLARQTVFNPELFFDRARADFYCRLCRAGVPGVSWLVYDFLPWLEPQFFGRRGASERMDYLMALSRVPRVAFISRETEADYQRSIMRNRARAGPIFALGGDALGLPRQDFDPGRRDFVVLGTIEPRKNVLSILDAFQGLWREGVAASLVLLGRIVAESGREEAMLSALAQNPNLTFIREPDETIVRGALSRARALLTASIAEGFGLPPYEALAAGIPVIAPANMPSIRLLPPGGQVRLAGTGAAEITAAVRLLLDDKVASRLFAEAAQLRVPTWADFSRDISTWLQDA